MNNIASPTRIDGAGLGAMALSPRLVERVCILFGTILLAVPIISFRPFPVVEDSMTVSSGGGDLVNQLGFSSLGALALFGLFSLVNRRVLAALLSPWWLLLLAFVVLSVLNAPSPSSAMRAALFTFIGMMVMVSALVLPRDADGFSAMVACAALIILGLCYFGVIAMPARSIHTAFGPEPEHAGLWRGTFSHKNSAAPVMGCFAFIGIYLFRRHWRWSGAAIFLLSIAFMANTGSKTTLGTVPIAMALILLPALLGLRFLVPAFVLAALIGMALATLGIVFIEPLSELQKAYLPGLTYTGRTAIWEYLGQMLAHRPWSGYGFDSFWRSALVFFSDQPFDRDWDFRGAGHGHNGYLDIAITMGVPALFAAIIAFILVPLRDFLRTPPLKENVFLADLFLMTITFILLNAFLESFFFRRAEPVWLLLVFALFGLRLVARFPVATKKAF